MGFISSPLFSPLRSFFSDTDGRDENGRARATGASIRVPHRWEMHWKSLALWQPQVEHVLEEKLNEDAEDDSEGDHETPVAHLYIGKPPR